MTDKSSQFPIRTINVPDYGSSSGRSGTAAGQPFQGLRRFVLSRFSWNTNSTTSMSSGGESQLDMQGSHNGLLPSRKGYSAFIGALFVGGENAGCGLLALSSALVGTSWVGVPLILWCAINAGLAAILLARSWVILEKRWPHVYGGKYREPYAAIGIRAFGPWMRVVVSVCLQITLVGTSTVMLLLCSEMISSLIGSRLGICFCFWIIIIGAVLCPLTWLGSPGEFWPAAAGALGTTSIAVVLLLWTMIEELINGTSPEVVERPTPNPQGFFLAFGTIFFSYGGTAAFPAYQLDMKRRDKFPLAIFAGFIYLVLLYVPLPTVGYYVYGAALNEDVTLSVPIGTKRTIAQICMAVHLLFSFLLTFNPPAQEIEGLLRIPKKFTWKRMAIRTGLVLFIVFLALSIPHFSKLLSLIGGSTMACLTYIFPPLFYLRLSFVVREDDNQNSIFQTNSEKPAMPLEFKPTGDDEQQSNESSRRQVHVETQMSRISVAETLYGKLSLMDWIASVACILLGVVGGIFSTYSAFVNIFGSETFTLPCYINFSYSCNK